MILYLKECHVGKGTCHALGKAGEQCRLGNETLTH